MTSSPIDDYFGSLSKPASVKSSLLDRVVNVGNDTRGEALETKDDSGVDTGFLIYGGVGTTSTSFAVSWTDGNADVTISGGVAYINGRRYIVPTENLTRNLSGTDVFYINSSGRITTAADTSLPITTAHIPIARIVNDTPDYIEMCRIWGNGYRGRGTLRGVSMEKYNLDGTTRTYVVSVADSSTDLGDITLNTNLTVNGDVSVMGDFQTIDSTAIDQILVGDFDRILLGNGGGTDAAPQGDFGFSWYKHNSTDSYSAGLIGLGDLNTRLYITSKTDMPTATNDANWEALLTSLTTTTVPEFVFTDGTPTDNDYLRINRGEIITGTAAGGTYALYINTLSTSKNLRIEAAHGLDIISANSQNLTLTPAAGALVDITGSGDLDVNNSISMNGSTLVDSSRNITALSLDADTVDANTSFSLNATTVINSTRQLVNIQGYTQTSGAVSMQTGASAGILIQTTQAGTDGSLTIESGGANSDLYIIAGAGSEMVLRCTGGVDFMNNDASQHYWSVGNDSGVPEITVERDSAAKIIGRSGYDLTVETAGAGNLNINSGASGNIVMDGNNYADHAHTGADGTNTVSYNDLIDYPTAFMNIGLASAFGRKWGTSPDVSLPGNESTGASVVAIGLDEVSHMVYLNYRGDKGYTDGTNGDGFYVRFPAPRANCTFKFRAKTTMSNRTLYYQTFTTGDATGPSAPWNSGDSKTIATSLGEQTISFSTVTEGETMTVVFMATKDSGNDILITAFWVEYTM